MAGSFSSRRLLVAALVVVTAGCDAPTHANAPSPTRIDGATTTIVATPVPDARPVVGLLASTDPRITKSLVDGATLAFEESRATGGPDLSLVVGDSTGAWSTVAAETVRLACDEHVVALVAPPERALAHPVAQAATRCRTPVISTSPAPTVTAAGSKFVASVVPVDETSPSARDETPVAPTVDWARAAPFVERFRARFGAAPDTWAAAGYDAGRAVVETVRRAGLSRDAFVAALCDGTAVTGAVGPFVFGRFGRRESATN